MKTLGLIGGTSWISTVEYYTQINQNVNRHLGASNYAECMIYSFNFQEIANNNERNDWDATFNMVVVAAKKLEASGAKGIVLCANTMHYLADRLQEKISIPVIHIASATAIEIKKAGLKKVGLLGTRFTMEYDFFKEKLAQHEIEAIIPTNPADIAFVHDSIFNELGKGIFKEKTIARYLAIIKQLKTDGAEGFIAGCTEIPLIITPTDIDLPYFDTLKIHCEAAVAFSIDH